MLIYAGICFEDNNADREFVLFENSPVAGCRDFGYEGYIIHTDIKKTDTGCKIRLSVNMSPVTPHYLYLKIEYDSGIPYSFNGVVDKHTVMRQSPHDPYEHNLAMPRQAVPAAGVKQGDRFVTLFCENPAVYDNYCTQEFDPSRQIVKISSSDNGLNTHDGGLRFSRHFHSRPIAFDVVLVTITADNLNEYRIGLFKEIASVFGSEDSFFSSIFFASNYMHYRKNETGYSDFWLVPGIDYANKQYTRDAFWQSMVLPESMRRQIFKAVYPERYKYAENALIYIIWAWQTKAAGGDIDFIRLADAVDFIESNSHNNVFYAPRINGRPSFRDWYDIIAFEDDDVISYNQGLFVTALRCLDKLGIHTKNDYGEALRIYRGLFSSEHGYFLLSQRKRFFAVDVPAGDLLSIMLFDEPLLEDEKLRSHFSFMVNHAATEFGFRVTCRADGSYLSKEDHLIPGYEEEFFDRAEPGQYAWGGSYFLYDMISLSSCCLHNVPGAFDEIEKRIKLELDTGGTFHEHINTVTGKPGKANQGWNAAIPSFLNLMSEKGLVPPGFFDMLDSYIKNI